VTAESATAALRKYVIPDDIAYAFAGDFAKQRAAVSQAK
jgi:hypothetical protein